MDISPGIKTDQINSFDRIKQQAKKRPATFWGGWQAAKWGEWDVLIYFINMQKACQLNVFNIRIMLTNCVFCDKHIKMSMLRMKNIYNRLLGRIVSQSKGIVNTISNVSKLEHNRLKYRTRTDF